MIKILVVDDERAICGSVKRSFEYLGFTVFTALTAKKATEIFEKKQPKIVFLDIILPDGSGLDLLKQFKVLDPEVIVIIITAKGDTETQKRAEQLGADEFITKPFGTKDLRIVAMQKLGNLLDKSGHMERPCLLIVDDEQKARDNLKDFIAPRYNCEILEAADGKTSVSQVKAVKPDIIFLDIRMPGMNGLEAVKEIKKLSPDTRIIVISAWKSPDVASKAMACGAFTYLDKPIDFAIFQERLEAALISLGKLLRK